MFNDVSRTDTFSSKCINIKENRYEKIMVSFVSVMLRIYFDYYYFCYVYVLLLFIIIHIFSLFELLYYYLYKKSLVLKHTIAGE